jgi:5S rRNA maturation endonuclease (ribonuclease M5)
VSTRLKNRQEKICQILAGLVEESAKGVPVVVEGKKDADALQSLGVTGPILTLKTGGKNFAQALEEIQATGACDVVLLLDFDRRGKEATKRLKQNLERTKVKPNLKFWVSLQALLSRDVQCIEGLTSYLQTLAQKTA